MCGKAWIGCIWLCGSFLVLAGAHGQQLMLNDTVALFRIEDPANPGISLIRYRFVAHTEYALALSGTWRTGMNQSDGVNQAALLQNLKYRSQIITGRGFRFSGNLTHDLGIQYFFDSIFRFHPDVHTWDARAEIRTGKFTSVSLSIRLSTRLFNAWDYRKSPAGSLLKKRMASFLTPLTGTFAAGFLWKNPDIAEINLGVAGGKFTWIGDRSVYTSLGVDVFRGVPERKGILIEYGLMMQLLIDREFFRRIRWNCDLQIFKNFLKPLDFSLKNNLVFRISRHMTGTFQTRMDYDEEVSRKVQMENVVTLGCSFEW